MGLIEDSFCSKINENVFNQLIGAVVGGFRCIDYANGPYWSSRVRKTQRPLRQSSIKKGFGNSFPKP